MARSRVKGGEKNVKTGQRWTRAELEIVLKLYVSDRQLKIHESNKLIQQTAETLGRTVRSVEAQLLMFRNLDRFGFSGFKNMNTMCKLLWKEYIDQQI